MCSSTTNVSNTLPAAPKLKPADPTADLYAQAQRMALVGQLKSGGRKASFLTGPQGVTSPTLVRTPAGLKTVGG